MRIGIDIDGTITDLHRFYIDYGAKYSYEKNLKGIIYEQACEIEDILNDKSIRSNFWNKNRHFYQQKKYTRQFAPEVIRKLKKQGHEIYIITARREAERKWTTKWLKENRISFDALIMTEQKLEYCIANDVGLMIEDKARNIQQISEKIPVICIDNIYNKECKGSNITRCYGWYDVYRTINEN